MGGILRVSCFECILPRMRRFIRLAMALVLAISLPLQEVVAYAMPLCAGMQDTSQVMTVVDAVDHASMGCEHAEQAQPQDNGNQHQPGHQCDKCFACYLAVAQAVTPFAASVGDYGSTSMLPPVVDKLYQTIPAPPFHPPRPLA